MSKQTDPFVGRWSIVASPDFDDDYLREEVEPFVELRASGARLDGHYHVGYQQGHIDGRVRADGHVILAFEGNDEMDMVNGAGTLAIDATGQLIFTLMYAHGDDYTFICERAGATGPTKTSRPQTRKRR